MDKIRPGGQNRPQYPRQNNRSSAGSQILNHRLARLALGVALTVVTCTLLILLLHFGRLHRQAAPVHKSPTDTQQIAEASAEATSPADIKTGEAQPAEGKAEASSGEKRFPYARAAASSRLPHPAEENEEALSPAAPLPEEEDLVRALQEEHINGDFDPALVASQAYCLLDFDSGQILAGKNAKLRHEPASLTKVMTALLLLEHYDDLSTEIVIRSEDLEGLEALGASVAGFEAGDRLALEDLLYGILLPSGADACYAAVRSMSGSREAFVAEMNQRAEKLGLHSTHFTNPTGLPEQDLYSSAEDLARLFYTACQDSRFLDITRENFRLVEREEEGREALELISTFYWKFNSDPELQTTILAGKSGYTGAEQCLATLFEKNSRQYILVTLAAETEDPAAALAVHDQIVLMNELLK